MRIADIAWYRYRAPAVRGIVPAMLRSIALAFAAALCGAPAGACALEAGGPFDDDGLADGA